MSVDPDRLDLLADPLPVEPLPGPVDATVALPGSKSITNRAVLCAALAEGTSTLTGVLLADDTEAMLDAVARLGAVLDLDRATGRVAVRGLGGRPTVPDAVLDARLSGTTSRFLAPVLAAGSGRYVLTGAEPLRARPMAPGFEALRSLGATVVEQGAPGRLPALLGGGGPRGDEVRLAADVSSQFVSGLLLAAPVWPRGLTVHLEGPVVSRPYLDMSVAVMRAFGASVERPDERTFVVPPTGYRSTDLAVEPDASAASYVFALAAVTGGRVRVDGLGSGSLQGDLRFTRVLRQMGAEVTQTEAFTEVRGTGTLHGVTVDLADLSDTAQTLAAVAVFADSPTEVTGIGFIRAKETDRIGAVVRELRRCGVEADETPDGFVVHPGDPRGAVVETYDDHRMAMSFALLGLVVPGIEIADPGCVAKTFPGYWDLLDELRTRVPRGQ